MDARSRSNGSPDPPSHGACWPQTLAAAAEEHPEERSWLAKVQDLLALHGFPEPGQRRIGPNKREILSLLTDAPSMYALFTTLRKRQPGALLEPGEPTNTILRDPDHPLQPEAPRRPTSMTAEPEAPASAIFAIGSDSFVHGSPPPSTTPGNSLPSAVSPAEQAIAYQRVHEACTALLIAAQQLTERYETDWRHWASASEDIARLKEVFGL